jgi:L-alanine-DL-glutamate epimerase-like enolase superfamily enzyme
VKSTANVVVATISEIGAIGRGECLPYPRYGESPVSVLAQIEEARGGIESGCSREALCGMLPAGAARNALDCALIDLEAKKTGRRAWSLLDVPEPGPVVTAYTLSMDSPEIMAAAAAHNRTRRLLKLKLGPRDAGECVRAVRAAAPDAELIVDANEAWSIEELETALDDLAACRVALVEQPLPARADTALKDLRAPIPLGADESCHTADTLESLVDRYQVVNIKLDKTGGLSEAIKARDEARRCGLEVMVGCMVATSLSMAPAMLITPGARFVDLDGPLMFKEDRVPGLCYEGDMVMPPAPELWG